LVNGGVKSKSTVPIGIVYYDDFLRSTGVNVLSNAYQQGQNYEFITDTTIFDFGETSILQYIPHLLLTNTTTAPVGFSKYKFVVKDSNIGTFMQTKYTIVSTKLRLADVWSFSVGDRVRWTDIDILTGLTFERDYQIFSYDVSNNELNIGNVDANPPAGYIIFGDVVEVYSPQTSEIWFETNEFYNVSDATTKEWTGNSYYSVFKAAGLVGTDAQLFGTFRNEMTSYAYKLGGTTVEANRMILQSLFLNYWWKGRVNVETPNQKKLHIGTLMRWGGALINNTQVNNLSVFDSGNYNNELNARFGDITGLRQVGYTLKILQWSNINSAFLGRRQIQNADGSTQLVITDNLIGTINPSEQEYGTKYPSSVVLANNNLFFFDAIKGVYCMDSGNGVITISDALAARFWLDIATLVKGDNRYEVISGYDFMYNDLYVTIKLTDEISSITIYFNVDDKRWKSFVEMYGSDETPIDWYGAVGQTVVTFLKGQVWEQNALTETGAPVYSKLFGVQRKFINEFVTNVEKSKVKVFLTHDMHVNTLPEIVRFQTPKNDMYPNGMYSELLPANYKYKEGVYYAALKNDANTKGIPVDDPAKRLQIATGRPMRGHCLSVKIEFFTPKYVVLMSSGVGQIISDKS
jgi:hypothetical protein